MRRGLPIALMSLVSVLLFAACGGHDRSGWVLVAQPEGATLYIAVTVMGCNPFDRINTTETLESVTIVAYVRTIGDCDDWGEAPELHAVKLKAPLGERGLRGCQAELQWSNTPNDDCMLVRPVEKDRLGNTLASIMAEADSD
jgi:hypothetical protein